jgi:DNA polymerase
VCNRQDKTYQQVAQIQSLSALRAAVEAFDGCALKHTAKNTVFADGNPASPLLFVGEAPGEQEDIRGKPFVGKSGQLLDKILLAAGWSRADVYIINTLFWRPPDNRIPTPDELAACKPFVERHISLVKPKVIVLLGATALKGMLGISKGITSIRGSYLPYQNRFLDSPIDALCTYHPSYLLRSPGRKSEVWQDMLTLKQRLVS